MHVIALSKWNLLQERRDREIGAPNNLLFKWIRMVAIFRLRILNALDKMPKLCVNGNTRFHLKRNPSTKNQLETTFHPPRFISHYHQCFAHLHPISTINFNEKLKATDRKKTFPTDSVFSSINFLCVILLFESKQLLRSMAIPHKIKRTKNPWDYSNIYIQYLKRVEKNLSEKNWTECSIQYYEPGQFKAF